MFIKFDNELINTDHVAHAHFYPKDDPSTNYVTPCVVLTLPGKNQIVLEPDYGSPETVWALLIRGAEDAGSKKSGPTHGLPV